MPVDGAARRSGFLEGTDPVNVRCRAYGAGMDERPSQYHVTIAVARHGGRLTDPARFAAAADRAAWRRSASVVTAYTAGQVITVVTVHAPGRPAAEAVARAVIAEALQHQPPAPDQHPGQARGRAAMPRTPAA